MCNSLLNHRLIYHQNCGKTTTSEHVSYNLGITSKIDTVFEIFLINYHKSCIWCCLQRLPSNDTLNHVIEFFANTHTHARTKWQWKKTRRNKISLENSLTKLTTFSFHIHDKCKMFQPSKYVHCIKVLCSWFYVSNIL